MPLPNCEKKPKKKQPAPPAKQRKPFVLSSKRYETILSRARQEEKAKAQRDTEAERKYRDYLKKGGEELMSKFKGNVRRTKDQNAHESREQDEQKMKQVKARYAQAKENEEAKRQEKIRAAQQVLDKLKPGPRSLHSAALYSEVLRARNIQRGMNADFERARKKQECREQKDCSRLPAPWFEDQEQKLVEKTNKHNAYKKELRKTIDENKVKRAEQRKALLKEERAERELIAKELLRQIERERVAMEKKRDAMRINALEAMKMVEQRRMRERMKDEVDDRTACVYNTGKLILDKMRKANTEEINERKHLHEAQETFVELSKKKEEAEKKENERIQRDITTMQLKFTAEEQERVNREKAAKQARIEAYLREVEQQKMAKEHQEEVRRFEVAKRFKNEEINRAFNQTQMQKKSRIAISAQQDLFNQVEEKQRAEAADREKDIACSKLVDEHDQKHFFEHAHELMQDAVKKQRPLYPFIKVYNEFKRNNKIGDVGPRVPRHLKSHIDIGVRPQGSDAQTSIGDKLNPAVSKEILQNCLKIDELIAKEGEAMAKKLGKSDDGDGLNVGKRDGLANKVVECGNGDARNIKPPFDCASMKSEGSGKVRYSMTELKKLNYFAAPSLH